MTVQLSLQRKSGAKPASLPIKLQKSDIHLGLLFLVFCGTLSNRVEAFDFVPFVVTLVNTNLFLLFAFFVIFRLIIADYDKRNAEVWDFAVLGLSVVSLNFFGKMSITHDIGLVTGGLAIWFYLQRAVGNSRFISLAWFALTLNILIAPVLFQFFKSYILIAEVDVIAYFWNLFGYGVVADGQFLKTATGVRLRMVGACSVFTNLSFGFLCYASMKALHQQTISFRDVISVGMLILLLALGNVLRTGIMLPSFASYEYWHHGFGATIFGALQFLVIVSISFCSVWFSRTR